MHNKIGLATAITLVFLSLMPGLARASSFRSSSSSMAGGPAGFGLSVAGGVAQGAKNLATTQNPAFLVYGDPMDADVNALEGGNSSDWAAGGGILLGNGTWGGALQAEHYNVGGTDEIYYGLGYNFIGLNTSIGVAGRTALNNGGGSDANIGALFSPNFDVRIGVTAYNLSGGPDYYGAGLAYDVSPMVTLVIDSSFAGQTGFDTIALAPGILIGNGTAALSYAYGFSAKGADDYFPVFAKNSNIGVMLKLGTVVWAIRYQMPVYAQYSTSLTFAL